MELKRENFSSGAPLEDKTGYSRMVKVGPFIKIGGTTAVQPNGTVYGENDAYAQAKYVFEKMLGLLAQVDATAADVTAVTAYITDMKLGAEVGRAYSEFFKPYKPLCTFVGTPALNRPTQLVEIMLEAVQGCAL